MAMKAAPEQKEEAEDWLVTYADAITLLMAFFVMLLNFSKIDIPMFEAVAAGIAQEVGMTAKATPTKLLELDIKAVAFEMQADDALGVDTDEKGVVMELASSQFYKAGSADIHPQAVAVLKKLAQTLAAPKYNTFVIEAEGHTDDDPISTARYPSNWELSAGRAASVVRFFIAEGMDGKRMKAGGFAETRPKAPNRDSTGAPIPENQALNRRVIVRVYQMSLEEREKMGRTVDVEEFASGEEEPPEDAPPPDQPAVQ